MLMLMILMMDRELLDFDVEGFIEEVEDFSFLVQQWEGRHEGRI